MSYLKRTNFFTTRYLSQSVILLSSAIMFNIKLDFFCFPWYHIFHHWIQSSVWYLSQTDLIKFPKNHTDYLWINNALKGVQIGYFNRFWIFKKKKKLDNGFILNYYLSIYNYKFFIFAYFCLFHVNYISYALIF